MTNRHEADLDALIENLEIVQVGLDAKHYSAVRAHDRATNRRGAVLTLFASSHIPDLEPGTLAGLMGRFPDFAKKEAVRQAFAGAAKCVAPWYIRAFGDPVEYRKQKFVRELGLIRVQYRQMLLAEPQLPPEFNELSELGQEIQAREEEIGTLQANMQAVREEQILLTEARRLLSRDPERELAPDFRRQLDERAARIASAAPGDDMTDLFILWATDMPTTLRTFALSQLFADDAPGPVDLSSASDFEGGGGDFGGGGATGSFSEAPGLLPDAASGTNESLGAFS